MTAAGALLCAAVFLLALMTGAQAESLRLEGSTGKTGLSVQAQSAGGVDLHFEIGELTLEPVEILGQTWQKVSMPGVLLPNNAGSPDLPGIGTFVAIPRGARVEMEIISARSRVIRDVKVSPAPVIPRETDDGLVYAPDAAIYDARADYPVAPAIISEPGVMRGVDFVNVGITPFAWDPASRDLTVYTEMDVRLRFVGGEGAFGEDRLRTRFWEPILAQHLINYASLPPVDLDRPAGTRNGWEYFIICPDVPEFIAWADSLKNWRIQQGISTEVFTLTDVGGETSAAIEAFVNNAYNTWNPAPDAFLLLADYPASGLPGITSPTFSNTTYPCISDNIYADVNGDNLPEMAHARIVARNPTDLSRMIGKMLAYERAPYTDPLFYDRPVIAGGWQTERWFILCTEVIYGHQANVLGKHPVREYAIYSGTPSTSWSSATNTSTVVNYFGPNGLGYIPATPQHLTDWGGNATRINTDLNAGAYMLMHRDHGMETGWGEPSYTNSSLAGLNNSKLPFVFSMNCLTGKYNYTSEAFAEAFHRMAQGALGLCAASEISYSFVNDALVWGTFDTLWPQFMPSYGPYPPPSGFATEMLPCFAMVSGKYFLQSSSWPYNTGDKTVTYHLFHHHGDAFMTLYSEVPQQMAVSHTGVFLIGQTSYTVQAEAGAFIALTLDGQIVGRATATGLPQEITVVPATVPGTMRMVVTKANRFRHVEDIPVLPPAGPYLVYHEAEVDDAGGDGDGQLDYGEVDGVLLTLRNVGVDATSEGTANLSSSDPHVLIEDGDATLPAVPAGGTATVLEPFVVTVLGTVPDQHPVPFSVNATAPEGSWQCQFVLVAQAPALLAGDIVALDAVPGGGGDGQIDPGDHVFLQLWVANTGHADAGALTAVLSTADHNISITQATASVQAIPAGGEALVSTFELDVLPGCPSPSTPLLQLTLNGAAGYIANLSYNLVVGPWFDDAEQDKGWALGATGDNATSGQWVRAEPVGTTYNGQQCQPEYDHSADPASLCFVTGNGTAGGAAGDADVDGGKTTIVSPVFDLTDATAATLSYWRWYTNNLGNSPSQDYWTVEANDGGPTWVQLERTTESANSWTEKSFDLMAAMPMTSSVRFRFIAEDASPGSLVEAAVDDIKLVVLRQSGASVPEGQIGGPAGIVSCGPNPLRHEAKLTFRLPAREEVRIDLYDIGGRRVRTLLRGAAAAGEHSLAFGAVDAGGRPLSSGIYFLRMESPSITQIRQVAIVR